MALTPSNVTLLQSAMRDAHASATPLRIEGAGTWLTAGRPVEATEQLSTCNLTGIVEYVPGDLVLTAFAGTSLREIAQVTGQHGQWLALEPYASHDGLDAGTIGATIATASQGPLALGFGRARDLILGLSFVTGDGTAVRVGGRVVKNVAGFDLVRLATGAWGTLGVITQVSLRLHARPAIDETLAIGITLPSAVDAHDRALSNLVAELNSAALLPVTSSLASLVLLADEAAAALRGANNVPNAPIVLLARATGNRARVDAQRDALSAFGPASVIDSDVWRVVRTSDTGNTTVRASGAPISTADTWRVISTWLAQRSATDVRTIIEPMRGAVRMSCVLDPASVTDGSLPMRTIAERLPDAAWIAVPSAVDDSVSRRLRATMDRAQILNRGILGESSTVQLPSDALAAR